MGYKAKVQRVDRGLTKSFYINLPAAVAEACNIEKGEEMEWLIEDKDTFILKRIKPTKSIIKKSKNR
jgi:bifunctional DNA-binding transcriptional regulator/antitoxin component of YhaV-PrlF toxin-antitoxin module